MTPQRHHTLPPKAQSTFYSANSFSILVVDDLPANRLLLKRLFHRVGYATHEAGDGVEALDLLTVGACPDLILLDVEMPEMDGIEATRRLRDEHGMDVPIIVASGNPSDEMRKAALAAGADLFLTKPFDFPGLLKVIAKLLKDQVAGAGNRAGADSNLSVPEANRVSIRAAGKSSR
ncbi:MAG: response regulator [Verrucomicrobiales bacterium]|nr:response regulator [Verrucomicrobiales bacterium]